MILFAQGIDMRTPQRTPAFGTQQVEPPKVILFTKDLQGAVNVLEREELFSDNLFAILEGGRVMRIEIFKVNKTCSFGDLFPSHPPQTLTHPLTHPLSLSTSPAPFKL